MQRKIEKPSVDLLENVQYTTSDLFSLFEYQKTKTSQNQTKNYLRVDITYNFCFHLLLNLQFTFITIPQMSQLLML